MWYEEREKEGKEGRYRSRKGQTKLNDWGVSHGQK